MLFSAHLAKGLQMANNQMLPLGKAPPAHCARFTVQLFGDGPSLATCLQLLLLWDQESHCRQNQGHSSDPPAILRKVWQVVKDAPHSHHLAMLWAAMNTSFFGFVRVGKICSPISLP